ncbi:MAG: hypothetical protein H6553_12705 [Chitinophagales bacterium]|nr:hypothetical protein [Chitinophagales bacterium]
MRNKTLFLLLVLFIISACKKENDTSNDLVEGSWKLVKVEQYNSVADSLMLFDYSLNNIIYKFNDDNKLIVSGVGHNTTLTFNPFLDGTYDYKLVYDYFSDHPANEELKAHYLLLRNSKYVVDIENNQLKLDNRYIDGSLLIFEKLNN